jgi:DNA-3-methyladenine glycosylase II
VIAGAQARLPGRRPCGFHFPCEAAAWSVLAQRLRVVQVGRLRAELIARHGEDGAFRGRAPWPGSTWICQAVKVTICGR